MQIFLKRNVIYRERAIEKLPRKLAADEPWSELLVGDEDNEVASFSSDFERIRVTVMAHHIIDALREMNKRAYSGNPICWKDAYIKSFQMNYKKVGWQIVMTWYRYLHKLVQTAEVLFDAA